MGVARALPFDPVVVGEALLLLRGDAADANVVGVGRRCRA
jgi:hypothetical protein